MVFDDFYKWVLKNFEIDLTAYKQAQMTRRIESLMQRAGVKTLSEYIVLLELDEIEKIKFQDFITINVTEFFRNKNLFEELENLLKREYFDEKKRVNIWSAACSLGCEPYSIAMILKEHGVKNYTITATDIDKNVLKKAKIAKYSELEVKGMDKKYLKYFNKIGDEYRLIDEIKSMVIFKKSDLILDNYGANFDLILCRNVVIYFNTDIKEKIYKKFSTALNKNGILFVGATESIYNSGKIGFRKCSTFMYRKI
ncbi:MAG: CheR family methyltransferase [Sarcina sp.]